MAERTEQIMNEAIGWAIRLRDADAATWEAFTGWLEADRAHLAAYEQVAELDEALDELPPAAASTRASPVAPNRRWVLGGAGAALVAASAAGLLLLTPASSYTIRTEAGQPRSIALEGGSQIQLNGGSTIILDRSNPRFARLEQGEALFSIEPDPSNPFRVEAGAVTIRNLGTIFNVEHEPDFVEVGLAQGSVSVSAGGEAMELVPGQLVRISGGEMQTGRQPATAIGSWTAGELSYSSATLAEVAGDIARTSGISIRAEPSVAQRRFSGTIILDHDRELLRKRLAALLDVEIRLAQQEWILAAPDR